MRRTKRTVRQFLIHGATGALLAALIAFFAQFWWTDTNWIIVGISAIIGFIVAGFSGENAIEFLKELFRWV
jgi:hypothetical protein